MSRTASSLNIGFSKRPITLRMEMHPGYGFVDASQATYPVRLYPALPQNDFEISAAPGTVRFAITGGGTREVPYDTVLFEGTDRVTVDYPTVGPVNVLSVRWAKDANTLQNVSLSPSAIKFSEDTLELVAPRKLHAAVVISYSAPYHIINFTPDSNNNNLEDFGNVFALYKPNGSQIKFKIPTPRGINSHDQTFVYVVYRRIVADSEGSWESPPGYPNDLSYPGKSEQPSENNARVERNHRFGALVERNGFWQFFETNAPQQFHRPYVGESFLPQYFFRKYPLQSDASDSMKETYASLDFNRLFNTNAQRFSGLQLASDSVPL